MDWQAEILAAEARVRSYIRQTPVAQMRLGGHDLSLKFEQMQHTGSFKARGAFNTLLSSNVPAAGVVAASGGNHGAAVAYAAAQLGYPAHIFVPDVASPSKIGLIERSGATCHVVPGLYADAMEKAQAHEAATGAMQIHAYDAVPTVAGQGTLMAEWEAQGLDADTILIAVGGGGLIGGSLAWLGGRRNVIAVEPVTSRALDAALEAGEPVDVPVSGIASDALGARRVGDICFGLARAQGLTSITVPDAAIAEARQILWQELRQWVEPSGACALAAITSGAYVPASGEKVAVLICGANPSPDPFGR